MKTRSCRSKMICLVLTAALLLAGQVTAQVVASDVAGHWAAAEVNDWLGRGLARGYNDGSFRPDNAITRAEFAAYLNRAFDLTQTADFSFVDVKPHDWYAWDVSLAVAANYMGGYADGTFRPNAPITRDEAANTLALYLNLKPSPGLSGIGQFKDTIPEWSKYVVDAVTSANLMVGLPDQTFRPTSRLTRAEAVVILERAVKSRPVVAVFDKAGTYGPETGIQIIKGDVTVTSADVTIRNTIIAGDLTLAESIGEGDVYLKKVSVQGNTLVKGGGAHSIHFVDFEGDVTSRKADVRLVVSGTTRVPHLRLENGAIVAEVDENGDGIVDVTVSRELPANATIDLSGTFGSVQVAAPQAALTVSRGSVAQIQVAETATDTTIVLNAQAQVASLDLAAPASVSGDGRVEQAVINTASAALAGNFGTVSVLAPQANLQLTSGSIQTIDVSETAVGATITVAVATQVTNLQLSAETMVAGQGQITTATVNTQQAVVLEGNFGTVGVAAPQANVRVAAGSVGTLNLQQGASGTTIALGQQTQVQTLEVNATANVTGSGTIDTAVVRAPKTVIQQQPTNVVADQGTTVNVGGQDVVGTGTGTAPGTGTTTPPTTGGGGGGGTTPPQPSIVSVSAINGTTVEVTFDSNLPGVNEADFAFDNGLTVSNAMLKSGNAKVVVLTTAPQEIEMAYSLSFKGKGTGKTFLGAKSLHLTWTDPSGNRFTREQTSFTYDVALSTGVSSVDGVSYVMEWTKDGKKAASGTITVVCDGQALSCIDGRYVTEAHTVAGSEHHTVQVTFNADGVYSLKLQASQSSR